MTFNEQKKREVSKLWQGTDSALSKTKNYYKKGQNNSNSKNTPINASSLVKLAQTSESSNTFQPFEFAPFSKKQAQVLTWWHENSPKKSYDGVIADGSIRSGKSMCLSLSFCMWAMSTFNMQNFALCGKTIGSMRRNVVLLLKRVLRGRGYIVSDRRADNMLIIYDGKNCNTFYIFGGKDEGSADLIQGITLAGVLFDEVALLPESFVSQATARCSVQGSKWWFNCNPQGPHHWFYSEYILQTEQKNLLYVHFTMADNPSLTKSMIQRYENLYKGVFYDRYIKGLWVAAQGLVYPMVAQNKTDYIAKTYEHIKNGRFFISIDYGTRNPFSMGLWCVSGNTAVRIKEFYHDSVKQMRQLTDEEYYTKLEEFAGGYYIQKIVIDPSAASFIQTVRKHARFSVRNAENNVLNGIRITASLLQGGRIQFDKTCKNILREFDLYKWNDTGSGKDEVVKQNDHAMDDMRYFCATILSREFKWVEWS